MIRFSLFGIPVEVQPFFWISLVILGGALSADTAAEIFHLILFVLAGFISILVHEMGHALTARSFGAESQITLQAFGGYASYSGGQIGRGRRFLVTAAGPGIQILLAVLAMGLLGKIPNLAPNGAYFLFQLMVISFFWALLNLLPVLPLDGGQMLNAALGPARIRITLWITIITAVGVALLMLSYDRGNFIFPVFMGMFAWQAFQALKEQTWR